MNTIKVVLLQTLIGGTVFREYLAWLVIIILGSAANSYRTIQQAAEARAVADFELARLLEHESPAQAFLFFYVAGLIIAFSIVRSVAEDMQKSMVIPILTRIDRWKYYTGSWLSILIFASAIYFIGVSCAVGIALYFSLPIGKYFWACLISEYGKFILIYTFAFTVSMLAKRPKTCFFIGIAFYCLASFFYLFDGILGDLVKALYFLTPARLWDMPFEHAFSSDNIEINLTHLVLVFLENILYALGLFGVGVHFFGRKDIVVR